MLDSFKKILSKFPPRIFSIFTLILILWLTLAPRPLGDNPPPLFPGADKLVHGIMFGFLVSMLLLDRQRKHNWGKESLSYIIICVISSSVLGIIIEFAQDSMGLGRGFEVTDMIADCIGSITVGIFWYFTKHFLTINRT